MSTTQKGLSLIGSISYAEVRKTPGTDLLRMFSFILQESTRIGNEPCDKEVDLKLWNLLNEARNKVPHLKEDEEWAEQQSKAISDKLEQDSKNRLQPVTHLHLKNTPVAELTKLFGMICIEAYRRGSINIAWPEQQRDLWLAAHHVYHRVLSPNATGWTYQDAEPPTPIGQQKASSEPLPFNLKDTLVDVMSEAEKASAEGVKSLLHKHNNPIIAGHNYLFVFKDKLVLGNAGYTTKNSVTCKVSFIIFQTANLGALLEGSLEKSKFVYQSLNNITIINTKNCDFILHWPYDL